jgi:hypothetical protein
MILVPTSGYHTIVFRTFRYATIAIWIFRYDKYSILKYGAILGKGAQHTSWGQSPLDLISFEHDLNILSVPKMDDGAIRQQGQATRVPNYAVHIETDEISEWWLLYESTEMLTEIPLSMACFRYETPGSRGLRTVEILDDPIGNPLAWQAEEVLRRHMPYPRDDLQGEETLSDKRFHIYRISETHHVIMDCAAHLWKDIEIPTSLLLNLEFCVSNWYAKQCMLQAE